MNKKKAVFLDRDGVIIKDVHLLTRPSELFILKGVPESLASLKAKNYLLLVVTNQPVVARGLIDEEQVRKTNDALASLIRKQSGPALDDFYYCPHHPNATLERYRKICDCRKPNPGMLLEAAKEWNIDLNRSFMIGDRITDIIAGSKAGCKTVLVETGAHLAPPIETVGPLDLSIKPDYTCADLTGAAKWILENDSL